MAEVIQTLIRFQRPKSFPKGLTLIELLIGIAISTLIMLALLSFFSAGQKYFITQGAGADTIEDSRYPLAWITRDIREAVQVVPTYSSYSTSNSCLVLKVPSIDEAGDIIDIDNNFDYIIYRLNPNYPNRLERIVDANDPSSRIDRTKLLADNVNSFELTFYDSEGSDTAANVSDSATIDITLESSKTGLGRTFQEGFNTQVKLRNK